VHYAAFRNIPGLCFNERNGFWFSKLVEPAPWKEEGSVRTRDLVLRCSRQATIIEWVEGWKKNHKVAEVIGPVEPLVDDVQVYLLE